MASIAMMNNKGDKGSPRTGLDLFRLVNIQGYGISSVGGGGGVGGESVQFRSL